MRAKKEDRKAFYSEYLGNYRGTDRITLEFCQEEALDLSNFNGPSWSPNLNLIANSYAEGVISDPYVFRRFAPHRFAAHRYIKSLPIKIAEKIAETPDKYPIYLVAYAEATCRENVASKIVPVGKIAEREGWFTI
jgi:hypothetical protein